VTPYNYKTFYIPQSAVGYINYPFAEEQVEVSEQQGEAHAVQPRL